MSNISCLVRKYEASGDPGAVSTGEGDLGGISYGIYQLASNMGALTTFLNFACNYENDALANYGRTLSQYEVNSQEFIDTWREIGANDPEGFGELQDAYAQSVYFDSSAEKLKNNYYDITTKSEAMQAVLMSRATQYGSGNMVELYTIACNRMGYDNLSYVDDVKFDYDMIANIYDFLIEECDNATENSNGLYHSPQDWANGSYTVVKEGLHNRFVNEKQDALSMLG